MAQLLPWLDSAIGGTAQTLGLAPKPAPQPQRPVQAVQRPQLPSYPNFTAPRPAPLRVPQQAPQQGFHIPSVMSPQQQKAASWLQANGGPVNPNYQSQKVGLVQDIGAYINSNPALHQMQGVNTVAGIRQKLLDPNNPLSGQNLAMGSLGGEKTAIDAAAKDAANAAKSVLHSSTVDHAGLPGGDHTQAIAQVQDRIKGINDQIAAHQAAFMQGRTEIGNNPRLNSVQKNSELNKLQASTNQTVNDLKTQFAPHQARLTQLDPQHLTPAPQNIPTLPVETAISKGSAYVNPTTHIINPTLGQKAVGLAKQAAEPFMNPNPEPYSLKNILKSESGKKAISLREAFKNPDNVPKTPGAPLDPNYNAPITVPKPEPHPLLGKTVKAGDRGNIGKVVSSNPDGTLNVSFINKNEGTHATKAFAPESLTPTGGGKVRLSNQQLVDKANTMVAESKGGTVTPQGSPAAKGQSERQYAKGVSENPTVPTPVQEGMNLGYDRKPNPVTMQTAATDIAKRGPDTVAQEINAIKGAPTDAQQAAGQLLLRHYIDTGQTEKAIMIANKVAKNSTEAGRAVQILAAQDKLTPAGALRDVMGVINKANEGKPPSKQIVLTPEKANEITKLAEQVQNLEPGSRGHQVAVGLLKKAIEDVVPPSLLRKVSTIQTIAQLLNPKTGIRNILGNAVMAGLENTAGVTAAGLSRVIHLAGGTHTNGLPNIGVELRSFFKGAKYGAEDVKAGIRTSGSVGQTEVAPNIFKNKVMHALEQATGYSLSVPDRAFYQAAFDGSLANQMKVAKVTTATTEMLDQANKEALYRTFQNNSQIAKTLSATKRGMNFGKDWGVGDLILKYPKTPGNILSVGLDYSPVGFVKGLTSFYTNAHDLSPSVQREAIMNLSRGLTGSGLIAGGALLASQGIITANASKDKDKAAVDKANGQGPFSFNFSALGRLLKGQDTAPRPGDVSSNYDWLQPNSIQLSMGANLVLNHKDAGGMINSALGSLDAASSSVTQQPVVAGVSKFISTAAGSNGQAGSVSGAFGQAVGGAPASFIPTIVNQIGQMGDNTSRNTYDPTFTGTALNQIKAKIPGLREGLQPRVGVDGQVASQYDPTTGGNNLFNIFLNPAFASRYKDNPVINEVNRLNQATGETKQYPHQVSPTQQLNGKSTKITSEQLASFQKNLGTQTMSQFNQIINSPAYQNATDPNKVNMLSNALTNLNSVTKIQSLGGDPTALSGQAKTLFNGGNLTAHVTGSTTKSGSNPTVTYQTHKAAYDAAVKAGTLTGAKQFSAQQSLNKEAITSQYPQAVLDFYGMSKANMNAYFKQDPTSAKALYDQAKALDAQLGGTKFKNGLATAKGTKGKSTKTRVASQLASFKKIQGLTGKAKVAYKAPKIPKVAVASTKTPSFKAPKAIRAPKIAKASRPKLPTVKLPKTTGIA